MRRIDGMFITVPRLDRSRALTNVYVRIVRRCSRMKYLRLTVTPRMADVPPVFTLIADSPLVSETKLLHLNAANPGRPSMLFEMAGDRAAVRERLERFDGVDHFDITVQGGDRFYLHLRPETPPFLNSILSALGSEGVIVVTPVVYRDGSVHLGLAGEAGDLQGILDEVPPEIDVSVEEVGSFAGGPGTVVPKLSDRQREALQIAFDLGYYRNPRGATHADVAERLGCAPSTAGEHLRKAEAKLVASVVGPDAPFDADRQ